MIDVYHSNLTSSSLYNLNTITAIHTEVDRLITNSPIQREWQTPHETMDKSSGSVNDVALLKYFLAWRNLPTSEVYLVSVIREEQELLWLFCEGKVYQRNKLPKVYKHEVAEPYYLLNDIRVLVVADDGDMSEDSPLSIAKYRRVLQRHKMQHYTA